MELFLLCFFKQGNREDLEIQQVDHDSNDAAHIPIKREGNKELAHNTNVDFSKRRKIEQKEYARKCDSASNENPDEKDRVITEDVSLLKIDKCDKETTNKCNSDLALNENSNKIDRVIVEDENVITNQSEIQTTQKSDSDTDPSQVKEIRQSESRIVNMCRNIVSSMCEKIQNVDTATNADVKTSSSDQSVPWISIEAEVTEDHPNIEKQDSFVIPRRERHQSGEVDERDPGCSTRHQHHLQRPSSRSPRRDEMARLRRTIQWLEEGARRMREDLAGVRSELHEERRASKVARREYEAAVREAKSMEAAKHAAVISELKAR